VFLRGSELFVNAYKDKPPLISFLLTPSLGRTLCGVYFSVKSVNSVVGGCFYLLVSRSLKICDVAQVKCFLRSGTELDELRDFYC